MTGLEEVLEDFLLKKGKDNNQCIVLYCYESIYSDKIAYFSNT